MIARGSVKAARRAAEATFFGGGVNRVEQGGIEASDAKILASATRERRS
jgi:hypothetical protein